MKLSNEDMLAEMVTGDSLAVPECQYASDSRQPLQATEDRARTRPVSKEQVEAEVVELLRQYAGSLARYAAAIGRNTAFVQDGIQETFLRFFAARISGQRIENPRAWLFRVLRNYLLDCNRKSGCMPEVALEEAVHVMDPRQDVELRYQKDDAFQHALAMLSPREQECFQLRLEGFGYEDIAQILKIRVGTVGALVARGLNKIRNNGLLARRDR